MLILTRKRGEAVMVDDRVRVKLLDFDIHAAEIELFDLQKREVINVYRIALINGEIERSDFTVVSLQPISSEQLRMGFDGPRHVRFLRDNIKNSSPREATA